eukprot:CAMPEP_0194266352 /NCGR_PEP_ID=MMETSP0169-20130528/1285_1 /TAXON_ID=218684 /ORGANISM="Corethron pennatum, Strain L29A3" /LENGTH=128 /DNA_ID=CAMNT_0039007015 /DNA_START=96 /DNA_END=482 /DNA_ORIENTATION=+
MRAFLALLVVVGAVSCFQPRAATVRSTTSVHGFFDKLVEGMEGNYKGGDDSPYAKAKAADDRKEDERKKKAAERRARGYTELKDVKKKSFAKFKYSDKQGEKEEAAAAAAAAKAAAEAPKKKKNFFGL